MSTHCSPCLLCGERTACCNDEHVLGVEIYSSNGCENAYHSIGEFCSLECFLELERRMAERKRIAQEEYPEWFKPATRDGREG